MDIVSRFSKITLKAAALLAVSLMIFAAPLVSQGRDSQGD